MFQKTKRNVALLAGLAGVNLVAGVAVASGVVPQPGTSVSVAAVSDTPLVTAPAEVAAPVEAAVEVVVETTVPPTTEPPVTTPPTTRAPRATATTAAPAPATAAAAAAPAPTAPPVTLPARLNPSSAQLQAAIQTLSPSPLLKPTEAQARQFGDTVCTAFDQGKTFAEVSAGVMSAASGVPLLGGLIKPADVNNAVRGAVQLFCPGHADKL